MDEVACVCANARRAAHALTARYDAALAPHGMKVTQLSLLHAIARREAPNLTALAAGTGLDRSTLGRNLRVLERTGFVTLTQGDDLRDRRVALTETGRARLREATRTWKGVQEALRAALGEDLDAFTALTRRLAALSPEETTP